MSIYLDDGDIQLHHGEAAGVLRSLPAGIVQTAITSPPYWALRDYGTAEWTGGDPDHDHQGSVARTMPAGTAKQASNAGSVGVRSGDCECGARRVDSQLGLEPTPEQYVERLVEILRELRRVLRDDGTLWLNIGDTYATGAGAVGDHPGAGDQGAEWHGPTTQPNWMPLRGYKPKDLIGVPWMVAFALRADGWYLRSETIWSKPNPMPESVLDRPTRAHEQLFLLAKSRRYYYDAEAIAEPHARDWADETVGPDYMEPWQGRSDGGKRKGSNQRPSGRNKRSVWTIAPEPLKVEHYATFPQKLVEPCILAGTSEHGACAACGAPWRRLVELVGGQTTGRTSAQQAAADEKGIQHARYPVDGSVGQHQAEHVTAGWTPTCTCGTLELVPQLVLDPFVGSGTTALVARRLHRRALGIELSAESLRIAADRTRQLSLFGAAT